MSYLRYRDDIETLEPDEQATIDGISATRRPTISAIMRRCSR